MKRKQYTIGLLALTLSLGITLMSCAPSETSAGHNSSQEVKKSLETVIQEGAFLVDVRTPGEFNGGNVPGSVNIPLSTVEVNLELFKDKKNIVVYCASGGRSSRAKSFLDKAGIQNVYNGGAWTSVLKIVKAAKSK